MQKHSQNVQLLPEQSQRHRPLHGVSVSEASVTARRAFQRLDVPYGTKDGSTIPFEMQPIVEVADGRVKACELLFRGMRPADWAVVDTALLNFLSVPRPGLPPVYVNLSNDILMSRQTSEFAQVATANDVTFELSEALSGYRVRVQIAEKVDELTSAGAKVALDDFGAGRDGLDRLYAIRNVAAIKIDREFLLTCMRRPDARRMLGMLIAQWRHEGIKSIAEGVENETMFSFARAAGVDLVQGWFVDSLVGMNLMGAGD